MKRGFYFALGSCLTAERDTEQGQARLLGGEDKEGKKKTNMKYWIECYKKYATFSGRARRKEYACFLLFNFLLFVIIGTIADVIQQGSGQSLILLLQLVSFLPGLSVFFRRMHDIGKSGIIIIPLTILSFAWVMPPIGKVYVGHIIATIASISALIVGVMALFRKGDVGDNKYGKDPKSS